jgi:hypothetical protein
MFDAAQNQGIISAEANPAFEATIAPEVTPQLAGEPAEPSRESPENTTDSEIDATKDELESIRQEVADTVTEMREHIEGKNAPVEASPDSFLRGTPTQMAEQMEEYLVRGDQLMNFEEARPYFDSVLAEDNYDRIKQNILENYGGEEVYVKAVGVNPNTGNQIVDFTNNSNPNNGTYFRYDMQNQSFIDMNVEKPGLFSRLFS